jgi:hypothetical protein
MACCKCCCENGTPPGECCGSPSTCCKEPDICCGPTGSKTCCEDPRVCCGVGSGQECCPEGDLCCGEECCPPSQECCGSGENQVCCNEGQYCCDGVCEDEPCCTETECRLYSYDSSLDDEAGDFSAFAIGTCGKSNTTIEFIENDEIYRYTTLVTITCECRASFEAATGPLRGPDAENPGDPISYEVVPCCGDGFCSYVYAEGQTPDWQEFGVYCTGDCECVPADELPAASAQEIEDEVRTAPCRSIPPDP